MEPIIVDCDLLEAAKENVQPLAGGRRVTALSGILSIPLSQRDAKLSATRRRLRLNVEASLEDKDDNTLEAYCALVYWTLENYPQGNSAESGLIELLEEATRVLKDDQEGRWRPEFKYLKLWVLYASYVERPSTIYRFLLANDIGSEHALLYEEYACVLERNNRRMQADEMYLLGIARQAQPLDRLKNRHKEFQKRMMLSLSSPPPAASSAPSQAQSTSSTQRRVPLATSRKPASDSPASATASHTRTASSSNSRLQIFIDPAGTSAEGNAYPDVGTRKTRIKENTKETGKINGSTIKQAGKSKRLASAAESSSSSKIAVYRDAEEKPHKRNISADVKSPPKPGFTPFVDVSTMAPPSADFKSPVKSSFTPFVDTSIAPPATPKFTPYKDDSVTSPTSTTMADAVIKVKEPTESISQAEALRRDPLKNYGVDSLPAGADDDAV